MRFWSWVLCCWFGRRSRERVVSARIRGDGGAGVRLVSASERCEVMEKFEAKNGLQIEADLGPVVRIWEGSSRYKENNRLRGFSYLNDRDVEALREFFQHERDQELGRWRWPENPDYVVYKAPAGERVPDARHVTVSNESNGEAAWLFEVGSGGVSGGDSWARDAARAYFTAHPEPKKPWHDAKPGEVWVITTRNVANEVAVQRTLGGRWQYNDGMLFGDGELVLESARRIWPEVSDA